MNFGDKCEEENLFEVSKVINFYVLKKLSAILWHVDRKPLEKDELYQQQVEKYRWVQPRHLELANGNKTANLAMWDVVTSLMHDMESVESPCTKLKLLSSAIVSLCTTFSLSFPGRNKKATTDDFIPSLVLVLLRSHL